MRPHHPSNDHQPPRAFSDAELALAVSLALMGNPADVLVVRNGYQARLCMGSAKTESWVDIATGDLDEATTSALKEIAQAKRLYGMQVQGPVATIDLTAGSGQLSMQDLKLWRKDRQALTQQGRRGEVDAKTQFEVASVAAWRCQMEGCGEDLRAHFIGTTRGNFGYFAHIVASSPSGPRGDAALSSRLANQADNIMLLCDKCHRQIDRVDPDSYTVERLTRIRQNSINEVQRLLNTLRFPAVVVLVVGGNIEGQSAGFNQYAAEQALWHRHARMAESAPLWFMRNGGHTSDSTQEHYWANLFDSLQTEIPALRNRLSGTASGGSAPSGLAVFPTHVTSILVLAGRLLGNSTTVHLFQPNRNAPVDAPGERWAWPTPASAPTEDKYKVETLSPHEGQDEAALLILLTADVPQADLPFSGLPMISVSASSPGHSIIGMPQDLELLAKRFDEALALLQDRWRIKRIHFVVVAPASACVLLGQKLQARNHAPAVLYERRRTADEQGRRPFVPTIEIAPGEVRLPGTGRAIVLT